MLKMLKAVFKHTAALAAAVAFTMPAAHAQSEEVLQATFYLDPVLSQMSIATGLSYSNIFTTDVVAWSEGEEFNLQAISMGGIRDVETLEGGQLASFALDQGFSMSRTYRQISLQNFRVDVQSSLVTVDAVLLNNMALPYDLQAYASLDADTGLTTLTALPLWTFSELEGSLESGQLTMENLRWTMQGVSTLAAGVGFSPPVASSFEAANVGYMVISMAPVPEASTLALMGLGLAGIVAVRRRHAR